MALASTKAERLPDMDESLVSADDHDVGVPDQRVMLSLQELLQDENHEVVLFNDSGLRSLALSTDAKVVAEGAAARHVTAAGEDVSGFRYVMFDSGLKLYFQPGLDLILVREPPPAC